MGRKGTGGRLKNQQRSFLNCELENANQVRDQDLDQSWVDSVRQQLIAWYEESQRDFPWRHENDPYRILVSEMMLVQTTVAAVIPYFERFLRRFPDVQTLASGSRGRCSEGVGRAGVLSPGQAASSGGTHDCGSTCRRDAPRAGRCAGVARRRSLHRGCDLVVCLRFACTDRGGELAESSGAAAGLAGRPEDVCVSDPSLGCRRTARAASGSRQVQPGAHGPGRPDLHSALACLPALSPGLALCGPPARDPGFRTGRDSEAAPTGGD